MVAKGAAVVSFLLFSELVLRVGGGGVLVVCGSGAVCVFLVGWSCVCACVLCVLCFFVFLRCAVGLIAQGHGHGSGTVERQMRCKEECCCPRRPEPPRWMLVVAFYR